MCGLRPDQFWAMTLREFVIYQTGFLERVEMEWDRTVWLGAFLGNHWRDSKTPAHNPETMRPHRAKRGPAYEMDLGPPPETVRERRQYAIRYRKEMRRLAFWKSREADTLRGYAHEQAKRSGDYDAGFWEQVGATEED